MCGIVGIFRHEGQVSAELYEGLLMLQHRGQDSAGMVTFDGTRFQERKDNGLVANIFDKKAIDSLKGSVGIGHVRYPTAGGLSPPPKRSRSSSTHPSASTSSTTVTSPTPPSSSRASAGA